MKKRYQRYFEKEEIKTYFCVNNQQSTQVVISEKSLKNYNCEEISNLKLPFKIITWNQEKIKVLLESDSYEKLLNMFNKYCRENWKIDSDRKFNVEIFIAKHKGKENGYQYALIDFNAKKVLNKNETSNITFEN
jgi:hypothetical protein